jgi:dTDP-4-amino-4,6-dideoxygalactose transaminase
MADVGLLHTDGFGKLGLVFNALPIIASKDADCILVSNYRIYASEEIFKKGLCLPAGPWVEDEDVERIVDTIKASIV